MFTSVHKKLFRICQWTGEAIENYVRIPIPAKLREGRKWMGCYGSGSTALAAMNHFRSTTWKDIVTEEEWKELCSMLRDSIHRRRDIPEGQDKPDFALVAAKHYETLKTFSGEMTLEEFHSYYDHEFQQKYLVQEMPKTEKGDGLEEEEDPALVTGNAPKPWRITKVGHTEKRDSILQSPDALSVPRCAGAFVEWFLKLAHETEGDEWNSCVIYFDPNDKKKFAIGSLADALTFNVNKKASDLMGAKTKPVFGDVSVIHKSETLKIKHRKRKMAEEVLLDEDETTMDADDKQEVKAPAAKASKTNSGARAPKAAGKKSATATSPKQPRERKSDKTEKVDKEPRTRVRVRVPAKKSAEHDHPS